jgi:hypothetical protein
MWKTCQSEQGSERMHKPPRADARTFLTSLLCRFVLFLCVVLSYSFECATAKDARHYFLNGMKKRLVASHRMNQSSSRSHCIFTLEVQKSTQSSPRPVVSTLSLVDLAGSEKASLTGASGDVLAQSIGINKSLFVLRKVIKALATLSSAAAAGGERSVARALAHVPYRDSTLTRLLQHSLGGNCLTLMLACISPSDVYIEENLSTLNYAGMAKKISNQASVNEDPQAALIRRLRAEIKKLRGMLSRASQTFTWGGGGVGGLQASSSSRNLLKPGSSPTQQLLASSSDMSLGQKLIDSVELIRTLMADNNELRTHFQEHAAQVENVEFQNATLNQENDELRDRIHFLEVCFSSPVRVVLVPPTSLF